MNGFKYIGYLDFRSRLTHRDECIEGGVFDTPEECRAQMERLAEIVQPMNGEYSICVVEFYPQSAYVFA